MLLKKLISKDLGHPDLKIWDNITTGKSVLFRKNHDFGKRAINGDGMHFRTNDPDYARAHRLDLFVRL
jgi:hypothetical protein